MRPFRGETVMSTVSAILKDDPAPITDRKPSLPRHAGRIVRRCLAKDPDRRYQTALDLRTELEELKSEIDSGAHDASGTGAAPPARGWWTGRRRAVAGAGAVLAVAAAATSPWWIGGGSRNPEPSYDSVPITADIGEESSPNWSPEGEFIAFERVRRENIDVVVKPVAGGPEHVRADGPGDEVSPRWSPDGRYLAYITSSEPGSPVFIVPPHGGTRRKLIETGIPALFVGQWAAMGDRPWSPDGRTLLVSRMTDRKQLAIFRVDRDDREAVQVSFPPTGSNDLYPTHSFDGSRIAFLRGGIEGGHLLMMSAAGGDPEPLPTPPDATAPAFLPGDRRLLFLSRQGATTVNLWELDLATGNETQLTSVTGRDIWPSSVSTTGRIAYNAFWHDTFLFVVDVATGERRQLTWHTHGNYGGCFSPDGTTIVYTSSRAGSFDVYLLPLDGGPESRLTDDPGFESPMDWSPDGSQLLFFSMGDTHPPSLYLANRDGGNRRRLLDRPISGPPRFFSRWSPDGERIACIIEEETPDLWTVSPEGTDAQRVVHDVEGFDWYLDARRMIYSRASGTDSEMVALNLETGEERSLFTGPFLELNVAPDGRSVAFCLGPGHMSMGLARLKLRPPADRRGLPEAVGEPELVVPAADGWHVHLGGWSPDSRSIVYTRDQDYGDIYELVKRPGPGGNRQP
jgi:Tol biopolymer transport system component